MRLDQALIAKARGWIANLWLKLRPPPKAAPAAEAEPARRRRRLPSRAAEVEETGRWYFRGERQFRWNGYDVLITMPGKHHPSVFGFEGTSHDIMDIDPKDPRKFIPAAEMAAKFARRVEGKVDNRAA